MHLLDEQIKLTIMGIEIFNLFLINSKRLGNDIVGVCHFHQKQTKKNISIIIYSYIVFIYLLKYIRWQISTIEVESVAQSIASISFSALAQITKINF